MTRMPSDRDTAVALLRQLGHDTTDSTSITAFQNQWQIPASGTLDATTRTLVAEIVAAQAAARQVGHDGLARLVHAHVATSGGIAAPRLSVELIEHSFRSARTVATQQTGADGRCSLVQPLTPESLRWPLEVRVLDDAAQLATTGIIVAARPVVDVELVVSEDHVHAPTEYERIAADVKSRIGKVNAIDLREDDLTFLAADTAWSIGQLTDFVLSQRLAQSGGAGGAPWYALLRSGALNGADDMLFGRAVDLTTPTDQLSAAAANVDPARARSAVDDAIREHVVASNVAPDLPQTLAAFSRLRSPTSAPQPTTSPPTPAHRRVGRLVTDLRHAAALVDAGLPSAAHIARMGRGRFVRRFVEDGTLTRADANRIFARAVDVHTGSAMLATELRSLAAPTAAALLPPNLAERLRVVSTDNPTLATLFKFVDLCECKDCRSISSPAAYLVDVLDFLKNREVVDRTASPPGPSTKTAKNVLFERRPDLGDLDLSCDNTNVPVPYIDLVCELLEQAVAPDAGIAFAGTVQADKTAPQALVDALRIAGMEFTSAAYVQPGAGKDLVVRDARAAAKLSYVSDGNWTIRQLRQTFRSADELAAAPAYVNDAAYETLRTSRIAFHLPFDLYHQETRRYFAQFDVPRASLMRALAVGGAPSDAETAAEVLGASDEERAIIVTPDPAHQGEFWNPPPPNTAATWMAEVDHMLSRAEIEYADLDSLLRSAFVNPDGALFIHHNDLSCDTAQKVIRGLDDAALDRIHRFLRLWRRLGWPMATLDHAIMGERLGNGVVDDALLVGLDQVLRLQQRLGIAIEDLLIFFGKIPLDGDPSRYAKIYANASANGAVDPALTADAVAANEKVTPPSKRKPLTDVTASPALALAIKPAEVTRLLATLSDPAITFSNLATLFTQALLARTLGRSIDDLLIIEALAGVTLATTPANLLKLLDANDHLASAGIQPADLRFLLTFVPASDGITDDAVKGLLSQIQTDLQAAYQQERSKFDATLTADENKAEVRRQLARLPDIKDAAISKFETILDNKWADTPAAEAAFTDQLLGRFVDTTPIKALEDALRNATPAQVEAARNLLIEGVLDELALHDFHQARDPIVLADTSKAFALAPSIAEALVRNARIAVGAGEASLLGLLGADALIDEANDPPAPPAIDEATFPNQYLAVRLLHQMALFVAAPALTSDEIAWLLVNAPALGWMRIDRLPTKTGSVIAFSDWSALQDGLDLLRRLNLRPVLDEAAKATPNRTVLLDLLAQQTGWDRAALADLDGYLALTDADHRRPATYLRLERAVTLVRRLGITRSDAMPLLKPRLMSTEAQTMRQALKTRYSDGDWLGVLKSIQDPLREQKRDALVAYLLANNPDMQSSDDLFDYFLVDVEMSSCQPTSRIVQAHGTVQLFVQRCLLGIEPAAVADTAEDPDWSQWTWMRNYRVWEANRKIFLYPEDWIEPALRDDKSEIFVDVENTLQQNALNDDNIEAAVMEYLQRLDDISFLEVVASCYEELAKTTHVFARTKGGDPATYYHRRYVEELTWTPWEKVDLDITGDSLLAFVRNARLHLVWPVFVEEADDNQHAYVPTQSDQGQSLPMSKPNQNVRIQLAVSERSHDRWLPKRVSKDWIGMTGFTQPLNRHALRFTAMQLPIGPFLHHDVRQPETFMLITYLDAQEGPRFVGIFHLTGCKGYPEPIPVNGRSQFVFWPQFDRSDSLDQRFIEHEPTPGDDRLRIATIFDRQFLALLGLTPGIFKVTCAQELSSLDALVLVILILRYFQPRSANNPDAARSVINFPPINVPLGSYMPFFYEDGERGYCVTPGFFDDGVVIEGAPRPPERHTLSESVPLFRPVIDLLIANIQAYPGDPNADFIKIFESTLADPRTQAALSKYRDWLQNFGTEYEFTNFYHPLVCPLRRTLYSDGVAKLMARETQLQQTTFDFAKHYQPTNLVHQFVLNPCAQLSGS